MKGIEVELDACTISDDFKYYVVDHNSVRPGNPRFGSGFQGRFEIEAGERRQQGRIHWRQGLGHREPQPGTRGKCPECRRCLAG